MRDTAGKSEADVVDALHKDLQAKAADRLAVAQDLEAARGEVEALTEALAASVANYEASQADLALMSAREALAIDALEAVVAAPRVAPDPPSTFGLYDTLVGIAQAAIDELEGEAP